MSQFVVRPMLYQISGSFAKYSTLEWHGYGLNNTGFLLKGDMKCKLSQPAQGLMPHICMPASAGQKRNKNTRGLYCVFANQCAFSPGVFLSEHRGTREGCPDAESDEGARLSALAGSVDRLMVAFQRSPQRTSGPGMSYWLVCISCCFPGPTCTPLVSMNNWFYTMTGWLKKIRENNKEKKKKYIYNRTFSFRFVLSMQFSLVVFYKIVS